MNNADLRARVISVFNLVAAGYDDPSLRFFPFCADRLVRRLDPAPGSKLLDVATGTGAVALAAAQAIGQQGRVIAVDLAESMLDRLQEKIAKFGVRNIDLHVMDAGSLEFRRDYFDNVVCSFGMFLLPDMAAGLREWVRVLKPGGRVMFTSFGKRAFQPMMERLLIRLERYDAVNPDGDRENLSMRLADPERCRELLDRAGLDHVEVTTEQLGYHLKDETQWWDVLWNSGMRGRIERIPSGERAGFRAAHLAEVRPLLTDKGLWLDVETHFAAGTKPG
ncbi:MAG: class I SAM-dependent methyltransferase [Gammaproteobacteria bacterium]|nr:class I SAM-dependent methyltransferase [Gammaproteobacteria bacterium]